MGMVEIVEMFLKLPVSFSLHLLQAAMWVLGLIRGIYATEMHMQMQPN